MAYVFTQSPITLPFSNTQPEPDVVVVEPNEDESEGVVSPIAFPACKIALPELF
jgi:hypothetical protein